jgi:UDP-glucose 4-epimerase
MSTVKVFGESTTNKPPWNENSICNPCDAYGKSKYEAEKLLLGLQDDHFKVAVVRSPLVYGVGVKANMFKLVKMVNRFPILPLGAINNRRSMVYVGNLIALLKHILHIKAAGVFIAGDSNPLSTTHLTQLIAKASKKKIILLKIPGFMLQLAKNLKPSTVDRLFGSLELDNNPTNKKLKFAPPFSTEYGIDEMVKWYKSL